MTTEQYSIGYDEGYQAGWNAAMDAKPARQEPVAREQVLVEHIEYQKAQAQKYFELYNQVCETAQLRLREIARMEARLASQQEPVAWFDKELNTFKWRDGLRNCDLADQQPLHIAPQPSHQESVRDLLISAASMAVVAERQGKYEGASWVADAVLERAQPALQQQSCKGWQGLTDEEIRKAFYGCDDGQETQEYILAFAKAIEAKLREKNA